MAGLKGASGGQRAKTPLPVMQIVILMLVRVAEPATFTYIMPFINEMVLESKVTDDREKIGYYSGIIESIFSLVQFFTVVQWAVLSDRIGRRPVIIIGLIGIAIFGTLFGFSKSFLAMIIFRSLQGAINGISAPVRASLADLCDSTNQTDAMALYGLTWSIGSILGNWIGGVFTHPVENMPYLFGDSVLFRNYPFLLPCFMTSGLAVLGLLFTICFFKETVSELKEKRPKVEEYSLVESSDREERRDSIVSMGDAEEDDEAETATLIGTPKLDETDMKSGSKSPGRATGSASTDEDELEGTGTGRKWAVMELLRLKSVQVMLASQGMLALLSAGLWAVALLFMYTPVSQGGLGLAVASIGKAMACEGAFCVLATLVFLTRLEKRFGVVRAFQLTNACHLFVVLGLPVLRLLVILIEGPHAGENGEDRSFWTWVCVLGWLFLSTFTSLAYSFGMIIINMAAPDKSSIGVMNGLAAAVQCAARVVGPALCSATFAASIDLQWLDGQFWWIAVSLLCVVNSAVAQWLPRDKAEISTSPLDGEQGEVESIELEVSRIKA